MDRNRETRTETMEEYMETHLERLYTWGPLSETMFGEIARHAETREN